MGLHKGLVSLTLLKFSESPLFFSKGELYYLTTILKASFFV